MTTVERASEGAMLEPHERAGLLKFLEVSFSLHELKSLAFDLGADYALFSHAHKEPLARDLVGYCERSEQLGLLVDSVIQQRPGDPFLALLLAKLPPALPRTKTQIVLACESGSRLNRQEMESALAEFFGVSRDQVSIMGMADGTFRLLLSLPRGTAYPQVRLGSHTLCKGRYEVFFITALDDLELASQQTWRQIVTNHPPRERSTALEPAVSWERVIHGREIDGSSFPDGSETLGPAQFRGSRFLARIPRAAWVIAFLVVLGIAALGFFAVQTAHRRSSVATQVTFARETVTAIAQETV